MFTGIIESTGKLRSSDPFWIDVSFAAELKLGQSVACDGVCLTVAEMDEAGFRVDLLEETKRLTRFGTLQTGDVVNVERAMKADDRLDGHIVQAHVEGMGTLQDVQEEHGDRVLTLSVPQALMKYMVLKGIIILNGIALTLVDVDDQKTEIQVAIIPHTWENTNLHALTVGDQIHVETDLLAKYVEKMLSKGQAPGAKGQ